MEENKIKLQEYAGLKAQVAVLEDKIEQLKPEVEQIVVDINPVDGVVETDYGVFSIVSKRKYNYSSAVVDLEKELKEKKKEQEATGEATYEETRYLKFNSANIS
jgi:archaellum component FlaC